MANEIGGAGQECRANVTSYEVEKPCDGSNASVSLTGETPTKFNFTLDEVISINVSEEGMLVMAFEDQSTLAIENFSELVADPEFGTIQLADGGVLDLRSLPQMNTVDAVSVADIKAEGAIGVTALTFDKPESTIEDMAIVQFNGQTDIVSNFAKGDVDGAVVDDNGDMVVTFVDETQVKIEGYTQVEEMDDIPQVTLADGTVIQLNELLAFGSIIETTGDVAPSEDILESVEVSSVTSDVVDKLVSIEPAAGVSEREATANIAETLAAIEPAAGDATGASGALGNTGAGFGSSVSGDGLGNVGAIGPIGVTSLQFDRPEFNDDNTILSLNNTAISTQPPFVVLNNILDYEDGNINFGIFAQASEITDALEVIVSGIPNGWTPSTTDITTTNGVFDPSNGTWTIQLAPGESLTTGPVFTPTLNSDGDATINVNAIQRDPVTNAIESTSPGAFDITVDAVADVVDVTATNVSGFEDNAVALNLSVDLTDTDGSESVTEILILDVPNGFTFNNGTDNGNGTWTVSSTDLPTLELSAPANYSGTVPLQMQVTNEEVNFTGNEFDFTNNTNTQTVPFNVTFAPVPDAPSLVVNNPIVKEDGSVTLDIEATLEDRDGSENLVVMVENLDSTWAISAGSNNGTYNSSTGVWTITMPAGQDYSGSLTLTPPADSDVDMDGLLVTATSYESDGTNASTSTLVDVVTDAVIDTPTLTTTSVNGFSGTSYVLNITNAVGDTDGSETLGDVTISGVPNGFSLSAGVDNGNGSWTVTQAQLNGLQLNTPAQYVGTFDLTVSVTATDNPTDTEVDLTDNQMTVQTTLGVVLDNPNPNSPSVMINGTHQVLEDGSILVPFSAALAQNAASDEILTVTLTGIDSSWTIATGSNNGTYNSSTGVWTITMPAGQNYSGGLTFTPPANSDVDMNGLTLTASAVRNGITETASANSQIIVDAVADMPDLDAGSNASVVAGQSISLNISSGLTDNDGSETLSDVTISGVPNGYSLSAGSDNGNGTWTVTQAQLNGLQLNTPVSGNGDVTLNISVTSTEQVTDQDFDLTNNTATNTDSVTINVNPDNNPPSVTFGSNGSGEAQVLEDGSVFVPITGTLSGASPQQLTVTLTGVPSTWVVATGANNGTYSNGTWTITMPTGQNYDGGLTFTPPADSDVDLTGLTVTATSLTVSSNETSSSSTDGEIIVDAVADMPDLNVNNANGLEGQTVDLDISSALTDLDGSETLSVITISDVPNGFSLSSGANQGNGVWTLTQSQLNGLQLNTPSNYSGSVPLTVSVTSTEQVTDQDFDLTNNTATNTKILNVVLADTANPPMLDVDGTHQVLEDGSVFVPFGATITGDNAEILTVTVTGIDSSWTIDTGANNGTYNASTGTWTITMPAGQDYDGGLTFSPPADSDLDLTGLQVSANAFAPETNTNASVTEVIQIITDAVADTPTLSVNSGAQVAAGQSVALNITNGLTDTDGSESLGDVTISGVPNGYSLSAGSNQGNGTWTVTQSQLNGLRLNTPATGFGDVQLTVTTRTTERVTDNDFNLNNNTATNSETLIVNVIGDNQPPSVVFGANGSGQDQCLFQSRPH